MPWFSLTQSSRAGLMSQPATTSTSGNFLKVLRCTSEMPPQPMMATRSFFPVYSDLLPLAKDSVETPVAMDESFVEGGGTARGYCVGRTTSGQRKQGSWSCTELQWMSCM